MSKVRKSSVGLIFLEYLELWEWRTNFLKACCDPCFLNVGWKLVSRKKVVGHDLCSSDKNCGR